MRVAVSQYEGIDSTPVLPVAAGCLVAAARQDPALARAAEFRVAIERQNIAKAVAALGRPDVLGLSLYPWNAAYSLAVAAAARAARPHCLIVAGGPSVPRRPDRAQRFFHDHPAVDILAFGEGELTFPALLRAHLHGTPLTDIPGLATRQFTTPAPQRITDFSLLLSPYLDGTFDELLARHRARIHMALFETNRGCPFSCTFCDWSLTKKVVEFPIERVHAELDWITANGFSHLMLADANFGIRPRDTAIARRLVELRQRTGRPATFYYYLTKNNHGRNLETIEILQGGGIGTWVGLAVQDFDDAVLEAVKRDNIQTGEAQKLRDICGERGIPTFNELILGLPGQTYQRFLQTIATAMPPIPGHDFVLFLCRLIDNTELGDPASREKFGLQTRLCQWKTSTPNFDPVIDEFQEVVVATGDMPPADWRRAYRLAYFASALYNLRLLREVLHHEPDLPQFLESLTNHLPLAAPGTVYAELNAICERYVNTLLANGPFVLSSDGHPPLPIDEALAHAALRRYDEFLAETEAQTGPRDAFRYQAFLTPRWGDTQIREATFHRDGRPVQLRFTPPNAATLPSFHHFAATHLSTIRARLGSGHIEELTPARFVLVPA